METEEPPRKRPRTDADDSDDSVERGSPINANVPEVAPITRDATYYLPDGDCVIRVEDVLFKVHRFLLVRDSEAFMDMFSMPQGNEQKMTDENPVIFYDEVDDFRALCWGIYALPTDYMAQADELQVDISKLVSLYLIAQKYQFESHEKYAQDLLKIHCSNIDEASPTIRNYFITCPSKRLAALLRISLLTDIPQGNEPSLGSILERVWLFRMEETPAFSNSYPLTIAKNLGLRRFIGELYYNQLNMVIATLTKAQLSVNLRSLT